MYAVLFWRHFPAIFFAWKNLARRWRVFFCQVQWYDNVELIINHSTGCGINHSRINTVLCGGANGNGSAMLVSVKILRKRKISRDFFEKKISAKIF
jgi:hypothetical protein